MGGAQALDLHAKGDLMPKYLEGAAVGFAWFIGYLVVAKYVLKPVATKYNVPILKDL